MVTARLGQITEFLNTLQELWGVRPLRPQRSHRPRRVEARDLSYAPSVPSVHPSTADHSPTPSARNQRNTSELSDAILPAGSVVMNEAPERMEIPSAGPEVIN